ncbi:MAG: NAD(+)/NADH kinase [Acidimicrobiales bacterium]
MATVAILANPDNAAAATLADDAARWLDAAGHRVRTLLLRPPDQVEEDGVAGPLADAKLAGADLAVSLGGDGTFLRMVPLAHASGVPILGVNFGHLGYLLQVEPPDVETALARALAGDVVIEERALLEVASDGGHIPVNERDPSVLLTEEPEGFPRQWLALNEVVVERTYPGHTVRYTTLIDGQPFLNYVADGVLVATATGSTAYNLSAGGPVLSPGLRSLVVTPVAPHLRFDRSVVLDEDQTVTVTIEGHRPAVLVVDGRTLARIPPGSSITCTTAPEPVRFVTLTRQGFGTLLRNTLAAERNR